MMRKLLLWVPLAVVLPVVCGQTYRGSVGGEVEIGEGNRSRAFTDLAKTFRPFSDGTPIDGNGWPAADFKMLFFDVRPVAAWFGADRIDDPDRYVPDWSGTYKLSFQGQAIVTPDDDPATIANQRYDQTTNLTTADVILPPGTATFSLKFTGTQRAVGGPANTGVTGLKLIRPGYPADGSRTFTDEFLASLRPYSHLRFMGALDTNDTDPVDAQGNAILVQKKWSDRHVPEDATQQVFNGKHGLAWEYIVELANETNKDIWINVPVSADDDYVKQLARLMHDTLKPGIRIYIEHGNEVWNWGFNTYKWNAMAANQEVLKGGSNLNTPATTYDNIAQRRHVRRLAQIAQTFLDVYGSDAFGSVIRPIYAGFIANTQQYLDTLTWFKSTIGDPKKYFYAVGQTHYYNDEAARRAGASVDDVLTAFRNDSEKGKDSTGYLRNVATTFGLKQVVYEGGPDILRPNVVYNAPSASIPGLFSSITACRDARMRDIVSHDMRDNWFALGGAEYTHFTISGGVSRYGCWGAVEDVVGSRVTSAKLDGILDVTGGALPAPSISSVVNAATYSGPIVPGAFATIFGQNLSPATLDNWGGVVAGGRLPAAVGGVSVRVAGHDAVVSFAGPGQVNFIVPSTIAAGPAFIELISPGGRANSTAEVAAYSPGFFANTLNGATQISGVFVDSNPPVYVAPAGAWPGVLSRPAKAGDWLQLYATGLGPSGAPYGQVLAQPYEIDKSQVTVTIDGVSATVGWAGVTFAGVFQVNVQVPPLAHTGSLPVQLTIAGAATQSGGVLTFE